MSEDVQSNQAARRTERSIETKFRKPGSRQLSAKPFRRTLAAAQAKHALSMCRTRGCVCRSPFNVRKKQPTGIESLVATIYEQA